MNVKVIMTEARSLASTVKGGPWLLTGVSGSGKDYIVSHYLKGLDFQSLDPFGAKLNGKWVFDVAKISDKPAETRVYGYGDNLAEVANTLRDMYEDGAKLSLIIIEPDHELFVKTNAAKARDAKAKPGGWKNTWLTKSKMTPSAFKKYIEDKRRTLIDKVHPDVCYIVTNQLREGDVKHGWHK